MLPIAPVSLAPESLFPVLGAMNRPRGSGLAVYLEADLPQVRFVTKR